MKKRQAEHNYVTSDERLKFNRVPLNRGLTACLGLEPIRFTMDGEEQIGFGAQTSMLSVPEAVYDSGNPLDYGDPDSPNDRLAMSYSLIIPVTVQAIKEFHALYLTLKASHESLAAAHAATLAELNDLRADFEQYVSLHP
jgi:hypothetical protein